jgi:ABC-type sugar transport system substrate-binding protein
MKVARRTLALAVAAIAVTATACSSTPSSPSSSAPPGSGAAAATSTVPPMSATEIQSLAKASAAKAGPPVAVPKKTIGYLRFAAESPADQRVYSAFVSAAGLLGWKVIPCDGAGDPTKFAACGNTLLNQQIDALVNDGIPPSLIAPTLAKAKTMGIPTIFTGGDPGGDPGAYSAGWVPPDGEMGKVLATHTVDQLKGKNGGIIVQGYPTPWGTVRTDALKAAAGPANIPIVSEQEADATNLVAGTESQMAAQLNAHPAAKGMWITFETGVIGASQAIQAKLPGKSFPNRPLLVTFYANLPTLQLIGAGKVDAAVEDSLEWSSWVAVDQLAEFFARKTAFDKNVRPDYGSGLDFWRPTLVTKDNLPKEGQLVPPPVDYQGFFKAKWKTEFNITG